MESHNCVGMTKKKNSFEVACAECPPLDSLTPGGGERRRTDGAQPRE